MFGAGAVRALRHDRNTNRVMGPAPAGSKGTIGVQRIATYSGALTALLLAGALSGCASSNIFDTNEHWFSRPFEAVSRNGGYAYSELKETRNGGPVGANDLVGANGSCPPSMAMPSQPAAATPGAAPASPEASSLTGGAIALGMTECDVVRRAGAPGAVQVGANPNGERTLVLTYGGGPRPGIYRFEGGRLAGMDRVEVPEPPASAKPKVAKKKKKKPVVPQRVSAQ